MNIEPTAYIEKNPSISIASRIGNSIHDFIKGYGTIREDGSVLWHSWSPPSQPVTSIPFTSTVSFSMPVIMKRVYPALTIDSIVSVQPMQGLHEH